MNESIWFENQVLLVFEVKRIAFLIYKGACLANGNYVALLPMQNDYKPVFRYGFGTLAVVAGFSALFFLSWTYEDLLPIFDAFNAERDWLLPWNRFEGTYTLNKDFYLVGLVFLVLVLASSLTALRLTFVRKEPETGNTSFFRYFKIAFTQKWRSFSALEQRAVIIAGLVLTCFRLYFLLQSRIGLDASLSYILFIDKGLPGILLYYPLPNNHIFYNLLCWPLKFVFSDPFWVMMLPAFIISTLGSVLIYFASRSVLNGPVAFLTNVLFSFSTIAFYYAIHGRGYFLVAVLTILAAISLYKIYENRSSFYWLVFIICSVAGYFTIPVYLYGSVAMAIWAVVLFTASKNRPTLKQLVLAYCFIGFACVCLYLPVLIGSGIDLLFFNIYVASLPLDLFLNQLYFKVSYIQGFILGQESIGFYIWAVGLIFTSVLLVFRKQFVVFYSITNIKPVLLFLVWCFMVVPFLLFIAQRSSPPERSFFFKSFFDFAALSLLLYFTLQLIFRKNLRPIIASLVIAGAVFCTYEIHKFIRSELQQPIFDSGFDARLKHITQTDANIIFANNISYSGHLRHTFFVQGMKDFIIDEGTPVLNREYEMLIIDQAIPAPTALHYDPQDFDLYFQNKFIRIYIRKDIHQ